MARQRSTKRNHRSCNARARRRVVGLTTGAGALLAFGLTPLATAPAAGADELDVILDPILNSLSSIDPTLSTDVSALAGSLDPAFAGDHAATAAALLDPSAAPAAASPDFAQLVNQFIYTPIHTAEQDWITSPFGERVDNFLNTTLGTNVIGNGADGTAAHPDGGAGGLLFGDGGNGWNSTFAGVPGGNGGAAFFGDGGNGGDGGAGTDGGGGGNTAFGIGGNGGDGGAGVASLDNGVGGAGGAGGNATGFFGIGGGGGTGGAGAVGGNGGDGGNGAPLGDGGNGGNGGNGGTSDGLPALGGAGGTAGVLGSHGAVGHYGTLADGPPSAAPAPISTAGSWLTNSDGQVVILHGTNEVVKVPPYEPSATGFGADDAAFLENNGFNAVRLGIDWAALEPEPGVFNDAYLASLEQTVQTLGNHGIYTLLDMHQDAYSNVFGGEGAPDWAVQTGGLPNPQLPFPLNEFFDPAETQAWDAFWSNAEAPNGVGLENSYAQAWEYVANYFNGNPDVAGFEIMNEPSPGSQLLSVLFGSPFFGAQELTPFYNQVDSAIRAVDPTTTVFFEPNVISSEGLPINLGTVDDPNTVLSFHDYLPGSLADISANNAEAYANSHGIPAFMTEFGASSNQTTVAAPMDAANEHLIGWTEWAFTGQNDITTTASPPSDEALVYNPELPPAGANVNTATLATLAEPYPQVVSGTPNSWSFDNGTFQLSYSTERVDGLGSFPAGSHTTISVPAIEYPNGYQVSVTGGQVVSAPNAPEVVIASHAGANTVTVTVSTAAGGASGAG